MKPVILACFLLSSLLSPAQEAPPITLQEEVSPAPDKTTSLAAPYLLDRIPDGTPPPPAKPKPPFLLPPAAARETTVYQEGGRSISISRIDPIALPPPPVPDAPLTEEQLAAWQAAKDAYAARIKHETFLFLGATVYLPENLPPRSYVTVWGNGRKPASFWSNADFRLISGIGRFARGDGSTCRIMMTWCPIRPELARNAALSNNRPWKLPEFPVFPGELADSLAGADAAPASACFIPKDPAAFQELDEKTISALRDLHELYNREHPRLLTAWQDRERARLAREVELKANPPKPKDIVIHHFDLGESRPVPPAPQPAVPPAPRPVRQPRSRRNRISARRIAPASKDRSLLLTCLLAVSSLAVIPAATSMIDTNGNQISDIYERAWNNGQLLPPEHGPESDADGDGWSLAKEAAAGTNPLPGGAAPNYQQTFIEHVPPVYGDLDQDGIEEVVSPETQLIYWPTVSGKLYQLETTPTLTAGSWLPVGAPRIGTGADMGSGVPITQPDGGTPDRMFFRVAVTDIDEDGDGLESAEEALLGTNPQVADTDGDGLPDQAEAIAGFNPNSADTDNDGKNDGEDADPREKLVDWTTTPEPAYVLVDVDPPAGIESFARDINDKGEVLFDNGIWASGQWVSLAPEEPVTGIFPPQEGDQGNYEYESDLEIWEVFNDSRQVIGMSFCRVGFTPDPGSELGGGDSMLYSLRSWSQPGHPQYDIEMLSRLPVPLRNITHDFAPLGIARDGKVVGIAKYFVSSPEPTSMDERSNLVVFPPDNGDAQIITPPSDLVLLRSDYCDAKVSPDGWIVSQFRKDTPTTPEYGLVMWDPQHQVVNLPAETAGWNFRANLTKLPNNRMGLVGVRGQEADGLVVMQDNQGAMQTAQTLSGHGIQLMSADGSGITRDNRIWRNGKLTPLRELCNRYGELLDAGWRLYPLKANSHGIYLIKAHGPGGEETTKLAVPVDLDFIKPGTEKDPVPAEIADDKEDSEGGVVGINWDDDNNSEGDGGHAKLVFKNDFDDPPGTAGEDDLVQIRLHKMQIEGAKARLKYDSSFVKIWRKEDRRDEVKSEETEIDLNEDQIVYLEGLKITEAEKPKEIELQVKVGSSGSYVAGDKISVHVATPIIFLGGVNPEMSGAEAADILYGVSNNDYKLGKLRIDDRKCTAIIRGKNIPGQTLYYSIDSFSAIAPLTEEERNPRPTNRDKEMKMALGVSGSHVIFNGHSNFGLGPNFIEAGTHTVEDYMNISNFGVAGIVLFEQSGDIHENPMQWPDHGGTNFDVRPEDVLGTVQNPWVNINPDYHVRRFPLNETPEFTLKPAIAPFPKYHFTQNSETGKSWVTIVRSTGDLPTLRYASCFMASCNTGRHFGLQLSRRPLVYTASESYSKIDYEKKGCNADLPYASYNYIEGIALGKQYSEIVTFLNKYRTHKDENPEDTYRVAE